MKQIFVYLVFTAPYSTFALLLLSYVFAFIGNNKSETPHEKRFIPFYGFRGQRKLNAFDVVSLIFLALAIMTFGFMIYYQIAFSKM